MAAHLGRDMCFAVYHSNTCSMLLTCVVCLGPVQPKFITSGILLHSGKNIERATKSLYCAYETFERVLNCIQGHFSSTS